MENEQLLSWDIYEIKTTSSPVNGVKLRGRIRKFWLENNINILAENTQDIEKSVRFALLEWEDSEKITIYLKSIINDISVELILKGVNNPVLSKLKVNSAERYIL